MEQGQIQDTLEQIFTEQELGQIVTSLRNTYMDIKQTYPTQEDLQRLQHIETALRKIGWVIDESQPQGIRTLTDYEL